MDVLDNDETAELPLVLVLLPTAVAAVNVMLANLFK